VDESLTHLTQEELEELIRHGRINASKAMTRQKKTNEAARVRKADNRPKPVTNPKAPDPEWLIAQKEKAERNIATPRYDKRRKADMQEASKF